MRVHILGYERVFHENPDYRPNSFPGSGSTQGFALQSFGCESGRSQHYFYRRYFSLVCSKEKIIELKLKAAFPLQGLKRPFCRKVCAKYVRIFFRKQYYL